MSLLDSGYDEALELQVALTTTAVNLSDKVDSLQGQAQLTSTPRVRLVTYSLQQLEQVQTDLERDWVQALEESTQPSPLDTVSYIDLKESQNTLVLGVDDPYAPESLELLRTYGAMISLRATGGGSARACNRANCLGESFRAGLEVEAFAGGQLGLCTSGFRFEGGVSGPGFLVAGHCAARDTQVKHAGDVVGDVLYQGVFQQSPADVSYVSWNDGYFGMGRPERWVFRNFADRRYPLSSTGTGGVEGSPMCLTGSVGNTRCGGVVSTDISVREVGTGIVFTEQHTMNGCAKAGDSGGPVFYSNVGHGIVAGVIINNTTDRVCIDETYFGTVEHIEGLYPVDVLP